MSDRIAVVEDDRELLDLLVDVLSDAGYEPVPFSSAEAALDVLKRGNEIDVIVTDRIMPGMKGDELLREARHVRPELNVIIITAFGSIDSAIELVKAGAFDYVTKPFANEELLLAVQRALVESEQRRQLASVQRSATQQILPGFVGVSDSIQELCQLVTRAAQSRHPVLITGESGTGKELVARAIHQASGRNAFVAINCGALPDHLLESELFGHEKGAFTGAERLKLGLLETAHGGTVFLDEIGELPLALQPKLLRALEQGEVRRVGGTVTRMMDMRVIAATNRDLEEATTAGRFREDLYWRLNVLHIPVPPLRDRASDVPLLAEHFLEQAAAESGGGPRRISREAMGLLTAYPWPGNVRELRNAVLRGATLAAGDVIQAGDLPPRVRQASREAALTADASRRQLSLRDLERAYVLEVLEQVGGNKSRAAEILGLDRKTLYRKLEEYHSSESPDAL